MGFRYYHKWWFSTLRTVGRSSKVASLFLFIIHVNHFPGLRYRRHFFRLVTRMWNPVPSLHLETRGLGQAFRCLLNYVMRLHYISRFVRHRRYASELFPPQQRLTRLLGLAMGWFGRDSSSTSKARICLNKSRGWRLFFNQLCYPYDYRTLWV